MKVNATLDRTLNQLMKASKDGIITLDTFARKAGTDRIEAMEYLKQARGGWFVIGRKGHKSRFLFGAAFDDFKHSEELRSEWRKKNGYAPNVIPTLKGQGGRNRTHTYGTGNHTQSRSQRRHEGHQTINVPAGGRLQLGRRFIPIPPGTKLEVVEA